jgi:hypothetical protein
MTMTRECNHLFSINSEILFEEKRLENEKMQDHERPSYGVFQTHIIPACRHLLPSNRAQFPATHLQVYERGC